MDGRRQSAQRTVLGQVDCFVQYEVVGSQMALDAVQPRDAYEDALVVSSSYLVAEPLESSWHLRHQPYTIRAICPNMERRRDWITGSKYLCSRGGHVN